MSQTGSVSSSSVASHTLVEVLPAGRVRTVAAVVLGAFAVAVLGQVAVPLWFTPVPLTLGTLAVLGVGAALGPRLAMASMGLFLVAGVLGAPAFAGGSSGWAFASFGYIVSYPFAAMLMGYLARTGRDRSVWKTFLGAMAANVVIFAIGATWLAVFLRVGPVEAFGLGVAPFLVGDTVKAGLVALGVPGLWAVRRFVLERRSQG